MRYLTIRKFSSDSGYTEAAIRSKIAGGVWTENEVWRRAPDGRVLIDVAGFEAWVELGKARLKRPVVRSVHLKPPGKSLSPPPLER
jgi:hypothetical protein